MPVPTLAGFEFLLVGIGFEPALGKGSGQILPALGLASMLAVNQLALLQGKVILLPGYSTIALFGYVLATLSCISDPGYRVTIFCSPEQKYSAKPSFHIPFFSASARYLARKGL